MSALNTNPKGLALGVLAVGALWYLSQRAAGATGLNFRSPLQPSSGVQAANSRFFLSPSQAGATVQQQAQTAAFNFGKLGTVLGQVGSWITPLQPSVTDAVPASMRLSEKASYDVNPTADVLSTGDFSRMDRAAVADDSVAFNGPGLSDPYDVPDFWMP